MHTSIVIFKGKDASQPYVRSKQMNSGDTVTSTGTPIECTFSKQNVASHNFASSQKDSLHQHPSNKNLYQHSTNMFVGK